MLLVTFNYRKKVQFMLVMDGLYMVLHVFRDTSDGKI